MAKNTKNTNSSADIFKALELLEAEKGVPVDYMLDKISKSIVIACKSNYGGNDDAVVDIDAEKNKFDVYLRKTVVEEVTKPNKEISLEKAREIDPTVVLDDKVAIKLDTKQFGRIAAQTARSVIRQGIRDGEREQLVKEFKNHFHEILTVQVDKVNNMNGAVTLKIGKSTATLPRNEQIPKEKLSEGQFIKVYIADIKTSDKGERVIISRTRPDFLKLLFEKEIPEVKDGIIEIKGLSRVAGERSKVAVRSTDENVDPIGACIGSKGFRIEGILSEIANEKIDLIKYSDDPAEYITEALSPAKVLRVEIVDEEEKSSKVYVADDQLSLAIGNKGQNVKLAAILTGWKIDIHSEKSEKDEEIEDEKTEESSEE